MNRNKLWLIVCLFIAGSIAYGQQAVGTALKVGSYNIRYDNEGDRKNGNGWPSRFPVVASIIQYADLDIFGAQEVLHNQLEDLQQALTAYDYVGVGRDDGRTKGEYAPIFYKRERFAKLGEGVFWLSETPDRPSKGWDAALPRICTWVSLRDKNSGKQLWFFNLHLDHVGMIAREKSCELVLTEIKKRVGDGTAILTGDFNVDQNTAMYRILSSSGVVKDSYAAAAFRYAWNGTFNAFDTNLYTESRIDHVFVSTPVEVKKYALLTDSYRSPQANGREIKKGDFPKELSFKEYVVRLPSDHFPVVVDLVIP
ncbi:endonuclease/exonuclease/phosphatase family metal-dependent hydrolase [Sphingobacterium allocomposti]|uniref:Endonuclease/exonuclease/phosphatase family metal-dependent hydrolase n=1 Tax=Sphingobacterium allocomposti TaxID=415956 RepID=A0A5S5DDS9_9SPHI|nr:endonuclease/exonuclease/phosphatase family protein [Sphingobacterium composti Yoo et al. 2007 non Ten et al. 2007]TYP94193.1 endonuclease/exonuclease/phosphatase family metal-dependent hydrolase [Sphingobacterium composti Yoo et al. 2007 non Ten et al. 2007]